MPQGFGSRCSDCILFLQQVEFRRNFIENLAKVKKNWTIYIHNFNIYIYIYTIQMIFIYVYIDRESILFGSLVFLLNVFSILDANKKISFQEKTPKVENAKPTKITARGRFSSGSTL